MNKEFFLIALAVSLGCMGEINPEELSEYFPEFNETEFYAYFNLTEMKLKDLSCLEYSYTLTSKETRHSKIYSLTIGKELKYNGHDIQDNYTLLIDSSERAALENLFVEKVKLENMSLFNEETIFVDVTDQEVMSRLYSEETLDAELRNNDFDKNDWGWMFAQIMNCYNYQYIPEVKCSNWSIYEFNAKIVNNNRIRNESCIDELENNEVFIERLKLWNLTQNLTVKKEVEKKTTGCKNNNDCKMDEKCEYMPDVPSLEFLPHCEKIDCANGYIKDRKCYEYLCMDDSDCSELYECSGVIHECVPRRDCIEVIRNGDPETKIDVLFVGSDYETNEELNDLILQLVDYDGNNNGLMSVEPFKTRREAFNIWMVNNFLKDEMPIPLVEKKKGNKTKYIFDRNATVYWKGNCRDYSDVVVTLIKDGGKRNRSYAFSKYSEAYVIIGNTVSNTGIDRDGRLLTHEFGHAFGKLADEYVEKGKPDMPMDPNCADNLSEAEEWWDQYTFDDYVSYFAGCSYVEDNMRPTFNSIMRDHTKIKDDFHIVNEEHLAEKLNKYEEGFG